MSETCPVCREPFQGGPRRYLDVHGQERVACADEHACADAWCRLPEVRERHRRLWARSQRRGGRIEVIAGVPPPLPAPGPLPDFDD